MTPENRKVHEVRLRVRYAETDKMGVVYHANFFVWMEIGRVELMRSLGFDYKQMEIDDDCHLPVADLRCRFKSPAYYDEQIVVRTEVLRVGRSLVEFSYEISRGTDNTLLAKGETTHLVVSSSLEKRTLPERYRNALEQSK
jgi:acyl-CoA thioester hydrolase